VNCVTKKFENCAKSKTPASIPLVPTGPSSTIDLHTRRHAKPNTAIVPNSPCMCPTHPRSHAHRPIFSLTTPTINSKTTKTKRQKETNNNFSPFFFFFFLHIVIRVKRRKTKRGWKYGIGMVWWELPLLFYFFGVGVLFFKLLEWCLGSREGNKCLPRQCSKGNGHS
jgi:hypothetical protein